MPFDGLNPLGLKKIFGTILKVEDQEDGTIKVYGVASSEARDGAGEIVRAQAMSDALPDYSRFPALREMHQPMAAGKVLEAEVDADGVTQIVAHVVDPVAIVKVRTGVYAGFSIGGKVMKRDPADRSIITALRLVEISLVDSPCNPDAVLTMWKADLMKIENPTSAEVIARAKELAKAAGTKRYRDFLFDAREAIVSERTLEAVEKGEIELDPPADANSGVENIPESIPAGDEPAKEAAAEAGAEPSTEPKEAAAAPARDPEEDDHAGEGAEEPAAAVGDEAKEAADEPDPAAALADAIAKGEEALEEDAPPAPEDPFADLERVANALKGISIGENAGPLAKGMYEVSRFADLLCSFSYVQRCLACEAEQEGDGSTIPAELAGAINSLGDILVRLAQEEVAELVASLRVPEGETQVEIIYCGDEVCLAEQIVDLVKGDTDLMASAAERVAIPAEEHGAEGEPVVEAAQKARIDELEDANQALEGENEGLRKALADAAPAVEKLVAGFQQQIDELRKRFDDEPLPAKTAGPAVTRAIHKGQDAAGVDSVDGPNAGDELANLTAEDFKKYLDDLSEAERGNVLMKIALTRPYLLTPPHVARPAA